MVDKHASYEIRKTSYSRGAWRVVNADTDEGVFCTDHWQDADGRWHVTEEPVCGESKAECVALVLRLLANAGARIRQLKYELDQERG